MLLLFGVENIADGPVSHHGYKLSPRQAAAFGQSLEGLVVVLFGPFAMRLDYLPRNTAGLTFG